MDNGWIKLHRKAMQSEIFKDITAWYVFTWLLMTVNKDTGKRKISRLWAAKELGIAPSTLYDSIKRISKVYKMATARPTAKYTEITLLNWDKYQHQDMTTDRLTDKRPTARRHSTRIENREYKEKEINKEKEMQPLSAILKRKYVFNPETQRYQEI